MTSSKRLIVATLLFTLGFQRAEGCTTFGLFRGKDRLIGKSFQWPNGSGSVVVNKRRVEKVAIVAKATEKPVRWVSKFGSVTFNQHGREFPLGGINEEGLVVEIMWAGDQDQAVDSRRAINELQWIQYQLDNYRTAREVYLHAQDLRFSRFYAFVHYLVCDVSGECTVVEPFIDGKTRAYSGKDVPVKVLANDAYPASLTFLSKHIGFGGSDAVPDGQASSDRFVRAAVLSRLYPDKPHTLGSPYAFEVLRNLAWGAQWNLVYDLKEKVAQFRTVAEPAPKTVALIKFDYHCSKPVKMLSMNQQLESSDVSPLFRDYTLDDNRKMVKAGIRGIESYLPPGIDTILATYPETTRCIVK